MTFKEISASLDSALQDLDKKKTDLDTANAAANRAMKDYSDAMAKAQDLRQQLVSALEETMPPMPDNVRIGIPRVA